MTISYTAGASGTPASCSGDSAHTNQHTPVTVTFSCTGTGLSYSVQSPPAHGTLSSISNGAVTYTPNAGFSGTDSFAVQAQGSVDGPATDTVSVTVSPPAAPSCSGDSATTAYQTATTITFSCTGTGLSYSLISGPSHGTLGAISGDQVTYTPNARFSGSDSFVVKATDVVGQTATDTVTVAAAIGPPTATITTPANGATYTQGQVIDASYACADAGNGPGLKAGTAGCSGTVPDGSAINTATLGVQTFKVTATSTDGQTATQTVHYTVTTAAKAATTIEPAPQVQIPGLSGVGLLHVSATLTTNNTPLAGKTVTFTTGKTKLCTAQTNPKGVAACQINVLQEVVVLLNNSYTASFSGDSKLHRVDRQHPCDQRPPRPRAGTHQPRSFRTPPDSARGARLRARPPRSNRYARGSSRSSTTNTTKPEDSGTPVAHLRPGTLPTAPHAGTPPPSASANTNRQACRRPIPGVLASSAPARPATGAEAELPPLPRRRKGKPGPGAEDFRFQTIVRKGSAGTSKDTCARTLHGRRYVRSGAGRIDPEVGQRRDDRNRGRALSRPGDPG